ncbi:uncharacterized protein TNIN_86722 [Trichonephila inaurata madagascariensis]|uniref:Uncharacterized protein n=1 Tax=Trichonephila inaurata madagascariensis TaxID=2747483 RepID=A0A8X6YX29_9ARAC|nr:uncharacterized protein TNIN_86722 [Trichonephila inaurata madagascariensis]
MASALHNLQASISRNLVRCLKHSSDISSFNKSRWRSVTSLSFNNSFVDDPCVTDASKPCRNDRTAAILTLKQKEKGDWRNLTLEEKQACFLLLQRHGAQLGLVTWSLNAMLDCTHVYYMSFSQPFCDVFDEPADEWKLILAGAFTTMGLMTLGMYLWLSQNVKPEDVVGPLSVKKELKDVEEITIIHENSLAKTA